MDKNLIKERKKLNTKLLELEDFIYNVEPLINSNYKYYTFEESINALNEIRSILVSKKEEKKIIKNKLLILKQTILKSCQHEIIVWDGYNTYCTICKKLIIDIPETTLLEIKTPSIGENSMIHSNDEHNGKNVIDRIHEIIYECIENEDLSYAFEALEEMQYNSNVKIWRLK